MWKYFTLSQYSLTISFLLCIFAFSLISTQFRFTNLVCTPFDEDFAIFKYCILKAVNRSYTYLSIRVELLKAPVTNISINFAILKRANGYKPFLYNVTFDACKFMRTRNANPVIKFLFEPFIFYSNINHTCPYSDDIIIEKVDPKFMALQTTNLPFPKGEYALDTNWYAYNKNRANVRIYGTVG